MESGLAEISNDQFVMKIISYHNMHTKIVLYIEHVGRKEGKQELLPEYCQAEG